MSTATTPTDKRQAILEAAFRTFARDGYGQSCVREIAEEAEVAKPTIYNRLGDKETLFREAMKAAVEHTAERSLNALEPLRTPGGDMRSALEETGLLLLRSHACQESRALRRLLSAEGARFPELLEEVQRAGAQRVQDALADRFARLALAKRLDTTDVERAGEQFLALLTGPMELRSALGTRAVPDEELQAVAEAAVDTFLLAYAPRDPG
ncbi:TetR/AcrR family transcriptional regulator [Nocardiopsis sp. RSe5-2]|uniref:TetR/AcrR family transcriptional regulator n=1 Tax=Nocardiopsis endophytica TaxID=3018445 RepID=A0ABT4U5K3_9ACTN|nr:TetR/AcrR family transcriptional regulator [Nocardiopsis endophytica]MDA2811617.1 TetR/AcrR family transcriptional regulator [Nocardiopsis endophytica]